MNKKLFQIKNGVNFKSLRRQIENSLNEKGGELKSALLSLLDELENSEVEYSEEVMKEQVLAIFAGAEDVPEAVQNSITKIVSERVTEIRNSIGVNVKDQLTAKIKNQIAAAVLKAPNKVEVENSVNEVLVKNQITGLTFGDVIDYEIATKWENNNKLYDALHQTKFSKFFYTEDDMLSQDLIAKQWNSASASTVYKDIQAVIAKSKAISTDYIYKRQQADLITLDRIEKEGELASFLTWVSNELKQQVVNSIVMAILIGDTTNDAGKRITTFETIGTKVTTDAFTYVTSTAGAMTVEKVRIACDKVYNPTGKSKWLVISNTLLTALSSYKYATGGDTYYRSKEEMAGQFGVDELYVTDIIGNDVICFIPDEYWVNEQKVIEVTYPTWEQNRMNYQYEKNAGGGIHGLLSSVLLKYTEAS